jgi:signal transduction histidine kinase
MTLRFKSILYRIIWLHVLALSIASVAVPLSTYFLLNTISNEFEKQTLDTHARAIAQYLTLGSDNRWKLALPPDFRTFYRHSFAGFSFSIVDGSNNALFSSVQSGSRVLNLGNHRNIPTFFKKQDGIYYGENFPLARSGHTVWIEVAQDLQHPDVIIDDIVSRYLWRVAWFTIPIMLLLLVTDIFIVRRALDPVNRASAMARAIDPHRIDLRLPTRNVPTEILPLVVTVNQALDRLEKGFRLQREFTADAAHELRTPLAVLRMRIDTLPDQAAAADLRPDLEIMTHIVNQLLDVAELEGSVVDLKDTVDLHAVCTEVASGLAPIAIAQNKDVALTGSESSVLVKGNAMMLYQAVRNLAENALNHTPTGSTVEINLTERGAISVLDEGPGIPAGERELIFRRFWRSDRSRNQGAGLGLAIVARIVEAHNGKIDVRNRPTGGAMFSLTFAPA